MNKFYNIFSKIVIILALATGWGGSAWAQDFLVEGKTYYIKAKFANASDDSYLTNNGTQLSFEQTAQNPGSYWIAERSGATDFVWRFKNKADQTKYLDANSSTGLAASTSIYANFNLLKCSNVSGVFHLNGRIGGGDTRTNLNIGTWGYTNSNAGFGRRGNGAWGTGHSNSNWTTDYEIEEVLLLNGNTNISFVDIKGRSLTECSVNYTNASGDIVPFTASTTSYDFGEIACPVSSFATTGYDKKIVGIDYNSGTNTLTLRFAVLKSSDAPHNGSWASGTRWYTLKNVRAAKNGSGYMATEGNFVDEGGNLKLRVSGEPEGESGLWTFVSTTNGYYLYNRAKGPNYVMGTTNNQGDSNTRSKMYEGTDAVANVTKTYTIGANGDGIWVCLAGSNKHLDDGSNSYLTVWDNGSYPKTSEGNRFLWEEVELPGIELDESDYTFEPAGGSRVSPREYFDIHITAANVKTAAEVNALDNTSLPVVMPIASTMARASYTATSIETLSEGNYRIHFGAELQPGDYMLSIPAGTFYQRESAENCTPIDLLAATYLIEAPSAASGYKVIIKKEASDATDYIVSTSAIVSTGRSYAYNGEFLDLTDEINPKDLQSLTINAPANKFVWGPVVDNTPKTITFEVRTAIKSIDELTDGFYQLQMTDDANITRYNSIAKDFNTKSKYVYVAPWYTQSEYQNDYTNKYTGVPSYAGAPSTFYYLSKSGSNVRVQSVYGHYFTRLNTPNRDPQNITSIEYNTTNNTLSFEGWTKEGYWTSNNSNGTEGPRAAAASGKMEHYHVSKVDLSDYDVYRVNIEGWAAGANIQSDPRVTYKGEPDNNYGLPTVYHNGYFFFKKGYVPAIGDFTITGKTYSLPAVYVTEGGEIKELTFSEKKVELGVMNIRIEDESHAELPEAHVLYTPLTGEPATLTNGTTYDFKSAIFNVSRFSGVGVYSVVTATLDEVNKTLTFVLRNNPNLIQFSSAPAGAEWAADTKWFTWRSNRNNISAEWQLKYLTTSAQGMREDCTMYTHDLQRNVPPTDRGGLWCFVGDINQFRIQNAAYGPEFCFVRLSNGKYTMARIGEIPSGAQEYFSAPATSNVLEGATIAYQLRIGTTGNTYLHINDSDMTTYSQNNSDSGNSYMFTITDGLYESYPAYDVYKIEGANVVYAGSRATFGRREGKPYLIVEKGDDLTKEEAFGVYAGLVKDYTVGMLAGSSYIKTINATKADASKDYYRVRLMGPVPGDFDHVRGDGTWQTTIAMKDGYFTLAAGAAFDNTKLAAVTASDEVLSDGTVSKQSDDDGLFKATYKIAFPNVIVHRPNGLLWKAKRYGINKDRKFLVGPHTPDYVEVEQKGGYTIKLQNTNVFEVTHFLKPGAADGVQIWYPTTASTNGRCKPMGYARMFNYLDERDTQSIAANHNNGAIIAAQFVGQGTTQKYANGYANKNIGGSYGSYFTAKLPSDFAKTDEYVLGFELSRLTDAGSGHFGEGLLPDGNASYLRDLAEDGTPLEQFTDPNGNGGTDNLLEGTISLRQLYHIRSAYDIADQLWDATEAGKFLEEETIIFPTKNTEWNNFHNVIPLAYNCVDYWGYTSDKTDVKNLSWTNASNGVTMVASIVGENTAGISINTLNNNFNNCQGIFTEQNSNNCRLSARYVTFKYPSGGVITTEGNEVKTATIEVKLTVDGKQYNVKRFHLRFVPDTDPVPVTEIIGHDEHLRSDATLESRFGKPYENINFSTDANYTWTEPGEPLSDMGNALPTADNGQTLYHQFPVEFGQMSYADYGKGVDGRWVEWGEYGLQHRKDERVSVNYLRAQVEANKIKAAKAEIQTQLDRTDLTDLERAFYNERMEDANSRLAEAEANVLDKFYNNYIVYADLSEQPGSLANLTINQMICPGTQFYVTAWLSNGTDYTHSGSPNPSSVIFRVQAKNTTTGKWETIESYCPGQISMSARRADRSYFNSMSVVYPDGSTKSSVRPWQQVAFTFTNTAPSTQYSEFRIQIDNNSRGSDGADLYLDDIRLYMKRPEVRVRDTAPVCGQELDLVRISTDFDTMMEAIKGNSHINGDNSGAGNQTYYGVYAILDKAKYEKLAAEEDHAKAFEDALLGSVKLDECKVDGQVIPSLYAFHTIKFYDNYENHNPLTYNDLITSEQREVAGRMDFDGVRSLVFNCKIEDENLQGGKEYVLVFSVQIDPAYASYEALNDKDPSYYVNYFNLTDNCRIVYPFTVSSANMVRLDGASELDPYRIEYCPGSAPNIKLTSYYYNLETGKPEPQVGVAYDWYYGTLAEYRAEVVTPENCPVEHPESQKVDHTLDQALMNLRHFYPEVDETNLGILEPHAHEAQHGVDYVLTDCMINHVKDLVESGKLKLYKTNALFSLPKTETDEDYRSVVAVKISGRVAETENGTTIYCAEPIEIKFYTKHETPAAAVGLAGVDYVNNTPYNVRDQYNNLISVPTRINSVQVKQLLTEGANKTYLRLPIDVIEPSGYYKTDVDDGHGVKTPKNTDQIKFVIDPSNTDVIVVETNDPRWKLYEVEGTELYMPVVGKLKEITARKSRKIFPWLSGSTESDQIGIDFSDPTVQRAFEPREGYYYVLRANFLEEVDGYDVSEEDPLFNPEMKEQFTFRKSELYNTDQVMRCPGTILIPLKIVPEYMKWTGRESTDWNNDRNWIRADYSDLVPSEEQNATNAYNGYPVNTTETEGTAYNGLPLPTNDQVVRQSDPDKKFEGLDIYIPMEEGVETSETSSPYSFGYAPTEHTSVIIPSGLTHYPALKAHAKGTDAAQKGLLLLNQDSEEENTSIIEYDMVAVTASGNYLGSSFYEAKPYYENTVKDITFEPGATMYGAEHLNYRKAWVEYSLPTDQWTALASPLQETYAGEWYAPTDGAQQSTPQFLDITYSTALNNRFAPAFYQRSWDKSQAKVYRMPEDGMAAGVADRITESGKIDNVAVSLDWSHVYNDVTVNYSAGGFSVKPVAPDAVGGRTLVRMPKADTSYDYYDQSGSYNGDHTAITRTAGKHNRLFSDLVKNGGSFTQVVENANEEDGMSYFLVANPFMTAMDMDKFFDGNTQFERKFWTPDGKTVSVQSEQGWQSIAADMTGQQVQPLTSFFVRGAGKTATVKYNAQMQAAPADGSATATSAMLYMIAEQKGEVKSTAAVACGEGYSAEFSEHEDGQLLIDEAQDENLCRVFTMAGGQALQINATNGTKAIPLGILAAEGVETSVTFSGVDALGTEGEAQLYDAVEQTYVPLTEDTTLSVMGNSLGRYYILTGIQQAEETLDETTGECYDLQGLRINTIRHGQIYIQNHKRILAR